MKSLQARPDSHYLGVQPEVETAPPAQQSDRHYGFIDAIRGIAAILVMLQHSLETSGLQPLTKNSFELTWLNLGETGVLAFFLISGFVIPLSLERKQNLREFWISRAFRIYPLYLAVYIVSVTVTSPFAFHSAFAAICNFTAHLFFVQEYLGQENFVGVAWTLFLEALWYASFALLFRLSLNRNTRLLVSGCAAMSMAAYIVTLVHGPRLAMGRISFLIAFVIGLLFLRYAKAEISRKHLFRCVLILLALIQINNFIGFYLRPSAKLAPAFSCVFLSWLAGFALFFLAFATRKWTAWRQNWLQLLGKVSFSIYLIHPLFMKLFMALHVQGVPYILLIALFTITVSAITYRFIEHPAIQIGRRVARSSAQPVAA
jgi:peptidoglycan/LPS O-acetylase OafA/YrhL